MKSNPDDGAYAIIPELCLITEKPGAYVVRYAADWPVDVATGIVNEILYEPGVTYFDWVYTDYHYDCGRNHGSDVSCD